MIFMRAILKRWQASRLRNRAEQLLRCAFGMKEQARVLQKRADDLDADATILEAQGRERAR